MTEKIDIFDTLQKIDSFDVNYFDELPEDQKKKLTPYMVMLWMGASSSEMQLLQVNAFLNSTVFDIPASKHLGLFEKLYLISSDGKKKYYKWLKKGGAGKKYTTCVDVIRRTYKCSSKTALEYVSLLDTDSIVELAIDLGEQEDTIKQIKKELK